MNRGFLVFIYFHFVTIQCIEYISKQYPSVVKCNNTQTGIGTDFACYCSGSYFREKLQCDVSTLTLPFQLQLKCFRKHVTIKHKKTNDAILCVCNQDSNYLVNVLRLGSNSNISCQTHDSIRQPFKLSARNNGLNVRIDTSQRELERNRRNADDAYTTESQTTQSQITQNKNTISTTKDEITPPAMTVRPNQQTSATNKQNHMPLMTSTINTDKEQRSTRNSNAQSPTATIPTTIKKQYPDITTPYNSQYMSTAPDTTPYNSQDISTAPDTTPYYSKDISTAETNQTFGATSNNEKSSSTVAIVFGVLVPLLVIAAVAFAIYRWYRKKYPVRMVPGKNFSKFHNPMYSKKTNTLSLVRNSNEPFSDVVVERQEQDEADGYDNPGLDYMQPTGVMSITGVTDTVTDIDETPPPVKKPRLKKQQRASITSNESVDKRVMSAFIQESLDEIDTEDDDYIVPSVSEDIKKKISVAANLIKNTSSSSLESMTSESDAALYENVTSENDIIEQNEDVVKNQNNTSSQNVDSEIRTDEGEISDEYDVIVAEDESMKADDVFHEDDDQIKHALSNKASVSSNSPITEKRERNSLSSNELDETDHLDVTNVTNNIAESFETSNDDMDSTKKSNIDINQANASEDFEITPRTPESKVSEFFPKNSFDEHETETIKDTKSVDGDKMVITYTEASDSESSTDSESSRNINSTEGHEKANGTKSSLNNELDNKEISTVNMTPNNAETKFEQDQTHSTIINSNDQNIDVDKFLENDSTENHSDFSAFKSHTNDIFNTAPKLETPVEDKIVVVDDLPSLPTIPPPFVASDSPITAEFLHDNMPISDTGSYEIVNDDETKKNIISPPKIDMDSIEIESLSSGSDEIPPPVPSSPPPPIPISPEQNDVEEFVFSLTDTNTNVSPVSETSLPDKNTFDFGHTSNNDTLVTEAAVGSANDPDIGEYDFVLTDDDLIPVSSDVTSNIKVKSQNTGHESDSSLDINISMSDDSESENANTHQKDKTSNQIQPSLNENLKPVLRSSFASADKESGNIKKIVVRPSVHFADSDISSTSSDSEMDV